MLAIASNYVVLANGTCFTCENVHNLITDQATHEYKPMIMLTDPDTKSYSSFRSRNASALNIFSRESCYYVSSTEEIAGL